MAKSLIWYGLTGLGAAFNGALIGSSLMSLRIVLLGSSLELALSFGLMGLAWGGKPLRDAMVGVLLGGFAGLLLGHLRIPYPYPILYPFTRAERALIYFLGNGFALLAVFLLGYFATQQRHRLAGVSAVLGWTMGTRVAEPFFVSSDHPIWAEMVIDAFGVGIKGASAALALAIYLHWVGRTVRPDDMNPKTRSGIEYRTIAVRILLGFMIAALSLSLVVFRD